MTRKTQHSGRSDQEKASYKRQKDAECLRENRRWRGAMYLGGYAIECKLKAQLMEYASVETLEELEEWAQRRTGEVLKLTTHSIPLLLSLHPVSGTLFELVPGKKLTSYQDQVLRSFLVCNQWTPSWRYRPDDGSEKECARFFEALDVCLRFIENSI